MTTEGNPRVQEGAHLIQSAASQSPSSGNALVHREFASFVVGKKIRSLGRESLGLGLNSGRSRRNAYRNDDTRLGEQPRSSG